MNLSGIEKFAVSTRRNLTVAVDAALSKLGFTADGKTPEKPIALPGGCVYQGDTISDETFVARWESLNSLISREGRKIAVERAAYTWFNRLVAIRILAKRHLIVPQLEWAANEANVPEIVYRMRTGGGTPNLTPAEDAALAVVRNDPTKTREQFAILVGAFCRETPILHAAFGEIDDWTMLLVPNNLLSSGGLVDALNDQTLLSDDDYAKDELIGWLYQYYIAERKAEVYDGFKKNKKAGTGEIPAATQIFTPNWIAKYLVENTVKDEETTFIDPCCGSGHMLLEGFKSLLEKYEEFGYSKRDAIKNIFEKNLTGVDLDPRARQLSTFALLIAASREDDSFADAKILPRVYDTSTPPADISTDAVAKALDTSKKDVVYEVCQALALLKDVGDNFGSLIKFDLSSVARTLLETRLDFVEDAGLKRSFGLILALTRNYSAIVTNPPYLGSSNLNIELKSYLEDNFKDGKSDLFAAFIIRLLDMCEKDGRVGMITMQSWMFLSSFETLRRKILEERTILSMLHLGAHAFDSIGGEVTQTTAFILDSEYLPDYEGVYYRLVDGQNEAEKEAMFLKAQGVSEGSVE